MNNLFTPTLAALNLAFQGANLTDKMAGMQAVEQALALERACSAFEVLSAAARANPWVKELSFRWRSGSSYSSQPGLKITPGFAESSDHDSRPVCDLSQIIEFSIAATQLADGTVMPDLVSYASRGHSDAMRFSFLLASREPSFSGRAARAFKAQLDMAESELSCALVWACSFNVPWMPQAHLVACSWDKKANTNQIQSSQEMANLMAGPALAAEIERRELAASAPHSGQASVRHTL